MNVSEKCQEAMQSILPITKCHKGLKVQVFLPFKSYFLTDNNTSR